MLALKAEGVRHAYGRDANRCEVLNDFSLEIASGELVALMGPSGSGKSTFLHLAAGLLLPEAGTIEVGGRAVTAMSDGEAAKYRRRHVGVVFQAFNLIDSLSVAENVTLPARLDRARPDPVRLEEILSRIGLRDKAARYPGELSGGERQRVALARALYSKPEVVLADEPTGNLDARSSRTVCELLKDLNCVEQSAILLVTHDPVVAAAATRVCFLRDGRIVSSCATDHNPSRISQRYLEICS